MINRRLAALALAVTIVAASGCGNSTKTVSSTAKPEKTQIQSKPARATTALTRRDLVVRANAICKHLHARLAATNTTVGKVQELWRITPQIAVYERAALAELIQLTPPSALTDDWQQVVNDARLIADNMVKLGEYAQANKLKQVNSLLTANQKTERRVAATSKRDGFKQCAEAI